MYNWTSLQLYTAKIGDESGVIMRLGYKYVCNEMEGYFEVKRQNEDVWWVPVKFERFLEELRHSYRQISKVLHVASGSISAATGHLPEQLTFLPKYLTPNFGLHIQVARIVHVIKTAATWHGSRPGVVLAYSAALCAALMSLLFAFLHVYRQLDHTGSTQISRQLKRGAEDIGWTGRRTADEATILMGEKIILIGI